MPWSLAAAPIYSQPRQVALETGTSGLLCLHWGGPSGRIHVLAHALSCGRDCMRLFHTSDSQEGLTQVPPLLGLAPGYGEGILWGGFLPHPHMRSGEASAFGFPRPLEHTSPLEDLGPELGRQKIYISSFPIGGPRGLKGEGHLLPISGWGLLLCQPVLLLHRISFPVFPEAYTQVAVGETTT